jgi:hypothetical protein
MLTGDEVPSLPYTSLFVTPLLTVVVHVALRGLVELLRTVEARDVGPAVQPVQFGGGEVNRLTVARGVVVRRRQFLKRRLPERPEKSVLCG